MPQGPGYMASIPYDLDGQWCDALNNCRMWQSVLSDHCGAFCSPGLHASGTISVRCLHGWVEEQVRQVRQTIAQRLAVV
jgi:hypothetical protein